MIAYKISPMNNGIAAKRLDRSPAKMVIQISIKKAIRDFNINPKVKDLRSFRNFVNLVFNKKGAF